MYKLTDLSGETVDLDDETTYVHLPSTYEELWTRMMKEIGYALSYMDYIHRESFPMDSPQRIRVTELVARFWREGREELWPNEERDGNMKRFDVRWLKEQILVFEDEIENMC